MYLLIILEVMKATLVCNCNDFRNECIPYCKTSYVYRNKLEREKMVGNIQLVDKGPFINVVKDKIKNKEVSKPVTATNIPLIVGQPPGVIPINTPLKAYESEQVNQQAIPPKYELNGKVLKYNNIDYDIYEARGDLKKQAEYNEELRKIYETIAKDKMLMSNCEKLAVSSAEKITTTTKTIERTTTKTKSKTVTVKSESLNSNIPESDDVETIVLKKRSIQKPNPKIESVVNIPTNEICNNMGSSETHPYCIMKLNRENALGKIDNIITVTKDLPYANTNPAGSTQSTTTVYKTKNEIATSSTPIALTSTITKTTIIPTTSMITMTKEITSVKTSTLVETSILKESFTPTTRTRFITSVKTATKTLYNSAKTHTKIDTQHVNEMAPVSSSSVIPNLPLNEKEDKMIDMLVSLKELLTEVKHIAVDVKTLTPKKVVESSSLSLNPESTTSDCSYLSSSKSRTLNDHVTIQDKFQTILEELSAIKAINMTLKNNLAKSETITPTISSISSPLKKTKSRTASENKTADSSKAEASAIEPDLNSEVFTRKVLEVMKMKNKSKRKTLTKTRTVTINKKKKSEASSSTYSSDDQNATHTEEPENGLETTQTKIVYHTETQPVTPKDKSTITLQKTVTKTISSSPSLTTTTETKTKTQIEIQKKTQSVTLTESLTTTKPITTTIPVTETKTESITVMTPSTQSSTINNGFIGEFKKKMYNVFKKQSQTASLDLFHSLVSENIISLASAINDLKNNKEIAKSDDKIERTVLIKQEDNNKRIEEEISEIKNSFNRILEDLREKIEEKEKQVEEGPKEEEENKVEKQSRTSSTETQTQTSKEMQSVAVLTELKSLSKPAVSSVKTIEPPSSTVKTSCVTSSSVLPTTNTTTSSSVLPTTNTTTSSSVLPTTNTTTSSSVLPTTNTTTSSSVLPASSITIPPESQTSTSAPVAKIKNKHCKDGTSECIIDIPTSKIPESVDIIYS